MKKIIINDFVTRQTPTSTFSHFAGTWDEIIVMAQENWDKHRQGYKPGVVLVPVPAERFFSGVVELTEGSELKASFEARRKDEKPYIHITAKGKKAPAKVVELVLYSQEILGKDASPAEADYEVISINASAMKDEPMTPMAMARNFLGLDGGTPAEYSAQQFAEAIAYWNCHAMVGVVEIDSIDLADISHDKRQKIKTVQA